MKILKASFKLYKSWHIYMRPSTGSHKGICKGNQWVSLTFHCPYEERRESKKAATHQTHHPTVISLVLGVVLISCIGLELFLYVIGFINPWQIYSSIYSKRRANVKFPYVRSTYAEGEMFSLGVHINQSVWKYTSLNKLMMRKRM